MGVRNAIEEDAQEIRRISLELTIGRDSNLSTGFVEYKTPDEKELVRRINSGRYYVAEREQEVIGFLSAFSNQSLRDVSFLDDEIVQHLLTKQFPFI